MNIKKITKKAMTEFVKRKLATDSKWTKKALLRLYANQTQDEKTLKQTSESNNVGFTRCHAYILTSYAEYYKKNNKLTSKQMKSLYKLMPQYHIQIIEMCDLKKLKREYLSDSKNLQVELLLEV